MRKKFPAGVRLIYGLENRKKRNGDYLNVLSILYLEAKILTSVHFIYQKTNNRIILILRKPISSTEQEGLMIYVSGMIRYFTQRHDFCKMNANCSNLKCILDHRRKLVFKGFPIFSGGFSAQGFNDQSFNCCKSICTKLFVLIVFHPVILLITCFSISNSE